MKLVIIIEDEQAEYGGVEWTATVEPPLNDGGPYVNWPTAASLLSAIADDIPQESEARAMSDPVAADEPRRTLDDLWNELIFDACASDGPIRDADVKNAVRHMRAAIEAEASGSGVSGTADGDVQAVAYLTGVAEVNVTRVIEALRSRGVCIEAPDMDFDEVTENIESRWRKHGDEDCWCKPYQDAEEPTVWIHRKDGEV